MVASSHATSHCPTKTTYRTAVEAAYDPHFREELRSQEMRLVAQRQRETMIELELVSEFLYYTSENEIITFFKRTF